MEFIFRKTPSPHYICANKYTYTTVWPHLLSKRVPAARSLCRWASRNGATAHCALKLRHHEGRGCSLVATRCIPAGQTLVSVPVELSISSVQEQGNTLGRRLDILEELASHIARELHNASSFHRYYLEFLHDVYNHSNTVDTQSVSLQDQLDTMYMGNSLYPQGVANAPYLSRNSIRSVSQRVQWIHIRNVIRRVEQSLPYFASKSALWGISIALSRGIPGDSGESGLSLCPLIDFCLHSFTPNAVLYWTHSESKKSDVAGVKWHDPMQPCVHLVSQRVIAVGEPITILYNQRRVTSVEDEDFWRLNWGFVPRNK